MSTTALSNAPILDPHVQRATAAIDDVWREAMKMATAALDLAEVTRRPLDMASALASLGRCQRGMGQFAAAENSFRKSLPWARCCGSIDLEVDLMCEMADSAVRLAALESPLADERDTGRRAAQERARDAAFNASRLAEHVADRWWECTVLMRCAQVLEQCGDADDARQLRERAEAFRAAHPVSAARISPATSLRERLAM